MIYQPIHKGFFPVIFIIVKIHCIPITRELVAILHLKDFMKKIS